MCRGMSGEAWMCLINSVNVECFSHALIIVWSLTEASEGWDRWSYKWDWESGFNRGEVSEIWWKHIWFYPFHSCVMSSQPLAVLCVVVFTETARRKPFIAFTFCVDFSRISLEFNEVDNFNQKLWWLLEQSPLTKVLKWGPYYQWECTTSSK